MSFMLTKKQSWRRVRTRRVREAANETGEALFLLGDNQGRRPRVAKWDPIFWRGWVGSLGDESRSNSWPKTQRSGGAALIRNDRCRSLPGSEPSRMERASADAAPRAVHFDACVKVLLVPSRKDMDEDLSRSVWWEAEDIVEFRRAAFSVWKLHGKLNTLSPEELADEEGREEEEVSPAAAAAAAAGLDTESLASPDAYAQTTPPDGDQPDDGDGKLPPPPVGAEPTQGAGVVFGGRTGEVLESGGHGAKDVGAAGQGLGELVLRTGGGGVDGPAGVQSPLPSPLQAVP